MQPDRPVVRLIQEDIDSGSFYNLATATGTDPNGDPTSDTDTYTEDLPQNPSILLEKTGTFQDENGDGYADVGETIEYAFTVTNDGNVTLTEVVWQQQQLDVGAAAAGGHGV